MNIRLLALGLGCCLISSAVAAPFELVSNLSTPESWSQPINANKYGGQQFTTGSQTYKLNSITISMSSASGSGGGMSGGFFVQIWSNGGVDSTFYDGKPLNPLETLSGPDNPEATGEENVLYQYASSGLTLSPNTKYWVVAGSTLETTYEYWWQFSESSTFTGVAGASIEHNVSSSNQGSDWLGGMYDDNPKRMSVEVEVIPEPMSAALIIALYPIMVLRRHLWSRTHGPGKLYLQLNKLFHWFYMETSRYSSAR